MNKTSREKHALGLVRKTGWLSALSLSLSLSLPLRFVYMVDLWWCDLYNNQEGQAEVTPDGARRHIVNTILPYSSPVSSLHLRLFQSISVFLHKSLYHRSQSSLKQTSVGSLSNSTGLLHHNRPPAVIVVILPATTLRVEEVQSNRAAWVPLRHVEPS